MATKTAERASARERLLTAAGELFYEEGVHSVGIDRVIERAGVAKASLYNAFGSKDELVRAYLRVRGDAIRERMLRELAARYSTARERLVGVFEVQGESFARPGYRGCAFVGASVEAAPDSSVGEESDTYRGWVRAMIRGLAVEAGAADPDLLTRQLVVLYDGAGVGAWMDHDPERGATAASIARILVDAAIPV
jgi:AcrR family transcriptional regulator